MQGLCQLPLQAAGWAVSLHEGHCEAWCCPMLRPNLKRNMAGYAMMVLRDKASRYIPVVFWSILFADDMAIVVPSIEHMQTALQVADDTFSRWGLELSLKKTKVMAVGHADPVPAHFSILRGNIETVLLLQVARQLLGTGW